MSLYLTPALIYLVSAPIMWIFPQTGSYIFTANLWLLSYPHTVATYQRSYFNLNKNKIKVLLVFSLFIGLNLWIYFKYDFTLLMNIYFYSQFFHYFRQNYGLAKINSVAWNRVDTIFFHLINILGLLVLWTNTPAFLGRKLYGVVLFEHQSLIFYTLLFIYSMYLIIGILKKKKYAIIVFIHLAFLVLTVSSPTYFLLGWLGLHLFHNIQYLKLNWELNKRVSFIFSYLKSVLIVIGLYLTVFYFNTTFFQAIPLAFMVILSVNYSHYYFDSYLWKRKYREAYP